MMVTHSTSKYNDLASIYVITGHAHASNAIIFIYFNGTHNTLFAAGSSKHANSHTAAIFLHDHCVGNANIIRNWNIDNDGTLFIEDSGPQQTTRAPSKECEWKNFPNTTSGISEDFCSF